MGIGRCRAGNRLFRAPGLIEPLDRAMLEIDDGGGREVTPEALSPEPFPDWKKTVSTSVQFFACVAKAQQQHLRRCFSTGNVVFPQRPKKTASVPYFRPIYSTSCFGTTDTKMPNFLLIFALIQRRLRLPNFCHISSLFLPQFKCVNNVADCPISAAIPPYFRPN